MVRSGMEIPTIQQISDLLSDGQREYGGLNPAMLYELLSKSEKQEFEAWLDQRAEETIAKMEEQYADADIPF
jgi:hypothetical protein